VPAPATRRICSIASRRVSLPLIAGLSEAI
jgi:hypothetical protein